MNLGIVGANGYWGQKLLARAVELPGVKVVCCSAGRDLQGLCAILESMRLALPAIRATASVDDVVRAGDVDAVVIASPAEYHYAHARVALINGKHVFLEKPMCLDSAGARALSELAAEHERVLRVDHTGLHSQCSARLRSWLQGGHVGQPLRVETSRSQIGIYRYEGVVWDLLPHDLALLSMLLPTARPVRVYCEATSSAGHVGSEPFDTAHYGLDFDIGVRHRGHATWLSPRHARDFVVIGDAGMLLYENNDRVRLFRSRPGRGAYPARADFTQVDEFRGQDDPLRTALSEFIDAAAGAPPAGDWAQPTLSMRVTAWLEALDRCARDMPPRWHAVTETAPGQELRMTE